MTGLLTKLEPEILNQSLERRCSNIQRIKIMAHGATRGAAAEAAGTTISFRWAVSFVILAVIACPPGMGALKGVNAPTSSIAPCKEPGCNIKQLEGNWGNFVRRKRHDAVRTDLKHGQNKFWVFDSFNYRVS